MPTPQREFDIVLYGATGFVGRLTAQYLFRQVRPLQGGETILYHAAAGGVGLVAIDMLAGPSELLILADHSADADGPCKEALAAYESAGHGRCPAPVGDAGS